jgi:hypothetical protein
VAGGRHFGNGAMTRWTSYAQARAANPGVVALARALPSGTVEFSRGCHTSPFFIAQEPPSLAFLGRHLSRRS